MTGQTPRGITRPAPARLSAGSAKFEQAWALTCVRMKQELLLMNNADGVSTTKSRFCTKCPGGVEEAAF